MDRRRALLSNAWLQLLLVVLAVVLLNTFAARHFTRLDLTADRIYSLDMTTRALVYRLERPLIAKVYFTRGLEAPYNNHEQILIDKLEDMRAYSKGWMDIQVVDPSRDQEKVEEAKRFGIEPIQYLYKSASRQELKKVYMGLALVYGDRQEVLPAVTQTATLEYELARALKSLVSDEPRKVIGYSSGFGEPDLVSAQGPLETLTTAIRARFNIARVPLGGGGLIPEEVDAMLVIGPQATVSERAQYQLDQFLMRGGAVAFFITSTKPDLRSLKPQNVLHGLDGLLGAYGVQLNRDVVVDRLHNGRMPFPVREGQFITRKSINYPLLPRASDINHDTVLSKGIDNLLFPFASSLTLADPLPPDVVSSVIASSDADSGRIRAIRTIDPAAYQIVSPGEETGSFPLLVALGGVWPSAFASRDIPPPPPGSEADDPAARLRESAPARMVVAGSGDFVGNNIPFMLNLVDWMVQDESLINIRAKAISLPSMEVPEGDRDTRLKLLNLAGGTVLLLAFGGLRLLLRRRGAA